MSSQREEAKEIVNTVLCRIGMHENCTSPVAIDKCECQCHENDRIVKRIMNMDCVGNNKLDEEKEKGLIKGFPRAITKGKGLVQIKM